jgi:hypothetical protein
MKFTYDLNTDGCLILYADGDDKKRIAEIIEEKGTTTEAEREALEQMIANSELKWIRPEEIGALTDAPILGLREQARELPKGKDPMYVHYVGHWDDKNWYEPVSAAWGFMDYQVRSFLTDLLNTGKAVFIGGNPGE